MYLIFAAMATYVFFWRFNAFLITARKGVFLAGFIFVGVGFLMEFAHEGNDYAEIIRIGMMILAGLFMASLLRDRQALSVSLWGFLIAGLWLSGVLFLSMYGVVSSATGDNFQEAADIRDAAGAERSVEGDLNIMSFFAAQGAVVALGLGLNARTLQRRSIFLAIGGFCIIGTFLPMSRGGILALALSFAAVLYTYGLCKPRVLAMGAIVLSFVLMWVPDVIFSRMTVTIEETPGERVEGRSQIYMRVVENFPEYFLTGVGRDNFYHEWGKQNGFMLDGKNYVLGTHNSFAQVTIYWGLAGLVTFLVFVWKGYRCLPTRWEGDPLKICVLGLSVAVLCNMMVVHTIYAKQFSIALGILGGISTWIWPRVALRSGQRKVRTKGGFLVKGAKYNVAS